MKTFKTIPVSALALLAVALMSCKKDPCKNVTCQNGVTCVDGNCRCSLPWEGSKCEVDARDKFAGAWRGTENCGGEILNVNSVITKSVEARNIVIDGNITAQLTSSTSFNILTQVINAAGTAVNISGNGSLNGNTLNITITYSVGGGAETCQYTLNRQ